MHWPHAIDRNRTALLAVVAAIAALIGRGDGAVARALRNAALALLRPAEAAARRLIVIAARGVAVAPRAPRPFPAGLVLRQAQDEAAATRVPAFPLFDRLKRFKPMLRRVPPVGVPRIRTFWGGSPPLLAAPAPTPPAARRPLDPDAPVDIARLRLRLASLEGALADLPRQARRLARRLSRAAGAPNEVARKPLRPGRPPGWRRTQHRDIDRVLRDCHGLACEALRPDTS